MLVNLLFFYYSQTLKLVQQQHGFFKNLVINVYEQATTCFSRLLLMVVLLPIFWLVNAILYVAHRQQKGGGEHSQADEHSGVAAREGGTWTEAACAGDDDASLSQLRDSPRCTASAPNN